MIRTRLAVPSHTIGSVERSRLLERVSELRQRAVTLVHAPAGFGKTTLLAQWKNALDKDGEQTAWLSIDPIDASTETLFDYLAMISASPASKLEAICNCLAEPQVARFMFVDDADLLPRPTLLALFDVIERVPPHVHFILSSRRQLDLPLGRFRSQKRIAEFDARSIAFDSSEARELLGLVDKSHQAEVIWHMGGWATGLDLAGRRSPVSSQPVTGRSPEVAQFLVEEVLDRQPPDIKKFLFETSILSTLSAPLCDTVCAIDDSANILPRLRRSGIFITPIDEDHTQWRYIPFFGEFLRANGSLSQERWIDLRKRAARWLVNNGEVSEALGHLYQAGAIDDYAALLEAHCETLTHEGKIFAVEKFANRLSKDKLATLPKVMLALAWLRIRQFRYSAARQLLDTTIEHLDGLADDGDVDVKMLRLVVAHRQTALATARDEMAEVDERSRRLIEELGDERPCLSCSLYSQMVYAMCDHFRISEFNQLEPKVRLALRNSDIPFVSIGVLASIGVGLFAAGRSHEASLALRQSYEVATPHRGIGKMEGMMALSALPLGELYYETNECDRATELIRQFLPAARDFCYSDQIVAGYVTSSRLAQSNDDDEGALRTLDEGTRLAWECDLERLRLSMIAEKIRILARTGRPSEAMDLARSEAVSLDEKPPSPKADTNLRDEIRARIWTRLAESYDRTSEAILVAKRWRDFCSNRGAIRALIRWNITLARLHCISGNRTAAQRAVRDAVIAAAPGHFIRSFVDEGTMLKRLLLDSYGSLTPMAQTKGGSEDEFVEELLQAFGSSSIVSADEGTAETLNEGLYGQISTKELEILGLVGRGLRNREIGTKLGLTEGTVKWYMQQIYDKLGVRRRPQAVERARQFGMLS